MRILNSRGLIHGSSTGPRFKADGHATNPEKRLRRLQLSPSSYKECGHVARLRDIRAKRRRWRKRGLKGFLPIAFLALLIIALNDPEVYTHRQKIWTHPSLVVRFFSLFDS
jgi:hypothetical protein